MIVIILFLGVLIMDQVTKHLVRVMMTNETEITYLGGLLKLHRVENEGLAFGIHVPDGWGWAFTALSALAVILIIYYLIVEWNKSKWIKSALALILGGAVGNLIDRVLFEKVIDFVSIGVKDHRWPTFNVADSAVVVGMFILFITMYHQEKKMASRSKELKSGKNHTGDEFN